MNTYTDYRKKIKSGDLLAWSHRGWRTWHDIKIQLMRMFTQSEYSHVGTAWVVAGRVLVIEAVEPKLRLYPLSRLGSFFHIPLKAEWSKATEEKALEHIGKDYKQLQAIRAYFEPLGKDNVSECAALAINIAAADNIDLGDRATPDAVVRQAQLYGHSLNYVVNE